MTAVLEHRPRLILLLITLALSVTVLFSMLFEFEPEPSLRPSGASLAIAGEQDMPFIPEPALGAEAYLVRVLGEGQPLMKRRAEKPLPPASITKILTALAAREELKPDARISISKEAKATEEKMSPFPAGTELELNDMLNLALVMSANDAARALAEAVGRRWGGGNFEERLQIFSALANRKAREIGMVRSYFDNPTGLDGNLHLASAEDLAVLAEYVWLDYPELWEITRAVEIEIRAADNKVVRIDNTNKLLEEFPAIRGGKTGFTDNAQETFLFLYPLRSGKTAVAVILGSDDRFAEARKIIEWLEEISVPN